MAAFIALPSPNASRRRDTASIAGSAPPGHTPIPQPTHAFLNVPYDPPYEPLYLAFIAGLAAYGLVPRATLEIPGAQRRLDRIAELITDCRYSFHDLSRTQTSGPAPRVPRFNMPFELGLAVQRSIQSPRRHQWFVFEERRHRITRSLSDLNGTDPYIHWGDPDRLLVELSNALVRSSAEPPLASLRKIHEVVRRAARVLKRDYGTLYAARPFKEVVLAATQTAEALR